MPNSWHATDIKNEEGLPIRHWTFKSIFPQISDRQAIQSTYLFEEDGWKYQLHTSYGNEYLEETMKANLGEHEVLMRTEIALVGFKPYPGGVEIRQT